MHSFEGLSEAHSVSIASILLCPRKFSYPRGLAYCHPVPLLEPIDAKIVWLRASGTRWKEICWEAGRARAAAHEHWLYALCVIAWRLNGRAAPKGVGRRELIGRLRAVRGRQI